MGLLLRVIWTHLAPDDMRSEHVGQQLEEMKADVHVAYATEVENWNCRVALKCGSVMTVKDPDRALHKKWLLFNDRRVDYVNFVFSSRFAKS